jgi:hypothetical protein
VIQAVGKEFHTTMVMGKGRYVAYGGLFDSIEYTRNRMQKPTIKIVNANLAYSINKYKNIKRKILICNANVYFNKSCLMHKITAKYANINIRTSKNSEAAKRTETQARTLRIIQLRCVWWFI